MKIKEQKPVLREISTIFPYPLNAKKHDEKQVQRLATSITKFGWRGNPIIVDSEGVIIAGHGRRLAAIKLGILKVPVLVESDMSAAEARAFRLSDNRSAQSDFDNDIFQKELLDLDGLDDLLEGIFDRKELDFAVAEMMTMNTDVFVEDLDTVMDEQTERTNDKIAETDDKRISIQKLLGFKDVAGSGSIYVTRFMAKLEAQTGLEGEAAFMSFVRSLVEG